MIIVILIIIRTKEGGKAIKHQFMHILYIICIRLLHPRAFEKALRQIMRLIMHKQQLVGIQSFR